MRQLVRTPHTPLPRMTSCPALSDYVTSIMYVLAGPSSLARQSLSHQSAKTIWLSGASTTTGTDTATKPKIHKLKTIWRPLLPYGWTSQCPDVKNYKRPLNPVWHRMIYSCTHMATLHIKVKRQLAWKNGFKKMTHNVHQQLGWRQRTETSNQSTYDRHSSHCT